MAVPIDPATSPKWALAGRIVTMDAESTVVMDGAIWIADADIAAITKQGDPTPDGFDGVDAARHRRDGVPRADRAPQPHRLQRAAAVARPEAVHEPRHLGQLARIPPARDRADEDDRRGDRAASGARPLRRVQGARRRRDHDAGNRAVQRTRRPALLPRDRPQRRTDGRRAAARGRQPHRRRRREGPAGVPHRDREEDVLPAAPERGHGRRRPRALRGAPAARGRVGDRAVARRDPLRRAEAGRLRR